MNNPGYSRVFVEGDGVTITGPDIGTDVHGQSETIDVIGDALSTFDCDLSDVRGSVYVEDRRFDVDRTRRAAGATGSSGATPRTASASTWGRARGTRVT